MVSLDRHTLAIGEGPCMDCPECGRREPFDLQFSYRSLRLGALGCAFGFRWLFRCRACREAWRVKRSIVRELEQGGVPIPFLQRDGLLLLLVLAAFFCVLLQL